MRRSLQRLAGRWRTAPAATTWARSTVWIPKGGSCLRNSSGPRGSGTLWRCSARASARRRAAEQPSCDRPLDRPHADRSRSRTRTTERRWPDRPRTGSTPAHTRWEARHAALSPATVFALGTDVAPPRRTPAPSRRRTARSTRRTTWWRKPIPAAPRRRTATSAHPPAVPTRWRRCGRPAERCASVREPDRGRR
ncbi:Uncharacterised protein [Mycobacterium tuberculosis]|uniref:Uncharacterized protein n=1 Tax=Mycobacterium tuberculosis TaxID=1773 RepID=A0A655F6L0_MYCTX|nr:Uncharacterised protein [Mycobacterium tuberculosis]CKR27053.1 Uncharacterised protein [Mycobacterium tuberculosis]CKT24403.1 Uncharacterised protein [Mycobacterium tuberculosis]CKV95133.1 Uncharacterised protein [Mycobacterium tuberculosis]CNV42955.1 Uncharacterised protein [Mycobacterium tuberculosis]